MTRVVQDLQAGGWIDRTVRVQWNEHHARLLDPATGKLSREHLVIDRGRQRIRALACAQAKRSMTKTTA
jgi:hypothetical protein